ncbi:LOW QUALITY PROTEIN: kinesin-like protein KIF18A [Alosa sapidissima]|uniref:LOW QUALITY PROTEIN: kinesin-like protein KIF18A n=1 Tax=Alosa sapidissima TaxID=34773 RepID=UPI001C09F8E9|nr:LOW QUALITY PROTEIN: kinesin-like protein KIF18A [Alosa sapidissima]
MGGPDVCSHVKVVVRVRPPNEREQTSGFKRVVQVVDSHMLIFDPKEQEVTFFRGQKIANRDVRKRANKDLKFVFDNVFGETSEQVEVFENTTKGVVDGVLNGYNCTVFAYGATGAGKTHTMLGSTDNPGVTYLTMKELWSRMEQVKDEKVFELAFSYLEVYNEQIRDLMANSGPLAVREDSTKGVVVQGLSVHQPKSAEHILEALDYGNKNRTQHPTDMNATSSRSHAVFQVYLRQQDKTASLNPNVRVAKMSLIDLAGSERASATNAKGARLREGANINRSLLALGNVINTLADPKSKKTHIPYRDSKLTRLLKDSLGGNCRTVMIANVSPSSTSFEDTHNTLKYANRAKEIKSSLKSNVVSLDSHISQYAVICEKQRIEIQQLKQKLNEYESRKQEAPQTSGISTQRKEELLKMSDSLRCVFANRVMLRREQLDMECQIKESDLRQRHREDVQQQSLLFFPEDKAKKVTCRYERKLASLQAQRQHLERRREEAEHRFRENDGWLHRVENNMKLMGQDGHMPEELQQELSCQRLQLQVEDLKAQLGHTSQLIGIQDQHSKHTHKLVTTLLNAYRKQYEALQEAGVAMETYSAERDELEHLVQRERGVVWADQEVEDCGQGEGHPADPASTSATCLQPLLAFSHLISHQHTPCSAEKHQRRVSTRLRASMTATQPATAPSSAPAIAPPEKPAPPSVQEPPAKKPIRRKLAVSPPETARQPVATMATLCPPDVQEVCRQEGMFPLQYTPEVGQRHAQGDAPNTSSAANATVTYDPDTTFDIGVSEDAKPADSTVILSEVSPTQTQALKPNNFNEPLKRLEIPSLLDIRRMKPSYMAMTSAAQGKRKLYGSKEMGVDGTHGMAAPKRIKHDSSVNPKPLRVRRGGVSSSENEVRRQVVRSISEGNLHMMGGAKSKTKPSLRSQLFRRVTKHL